MVYLTKNSIYEHKILELLLNKGADPNIPDD